MAFKARSLHERALSGETTRCQSHRLQKSKTTQKTKKKIREKKNKITTTLSRGQLLASERELSGNADDDAEVVAEAEAKALGARKHVVFKLQSGDQFKFVRRATQS